MKKLMLACSAVLCVCALALPALAQDKATPEEVYNKVVQAASLLQNLGPDGLDAFNDPQGEFVWKDSYVFILNCEDGKIAAHPMKKYIGLPAGKIKCYKTGRPIMMEACGKVNEKGLWKEYWWPKMGEKGTHRKISFLIPVQGTPYQAGAGIYDETTDVEALNKALGN